MNVPRPVLYSPSCLPWPFILPLVQPWTDNLNAKMYVCGQIRKLPFELVLHVFWPSKTVYGRGPSKLSLH